jgi:transposase-like protein
MDCSMTEVMSEKIPAPGSELNLDTPRDRPSSFESKLVAKHQRHMPGFDDHFINNTIVQSLFA